MNFGENYPRRQTTRLVTKHDMTVKGDTASLPGSVWGSVGRIAEEPISC